MKLSLCYPLEIPFGMTQGFGENKLALYKDMLGLLGHNGIDMSAQDGTPVYATHDGEVTFAGEDGSAGLGVVIRTLEQFDYNETSSHFKTIYWHLKTGSILVKPNQKVKAGEKIAEADNTGMSTGSHLHFGLKPTYQGEQAWQWWNAEQTNGYAGSIDPAPYFNGKSPRQARDVVEVPTPFLVMQEAIRNFQFSEGLMDFKGTPLKGVRFGPKTLLKCLKFYK